MDTSHAPPIAVIGIACRFPGEANSPLGFWELLKSGRNGYATQTQRYNADAFYHPNKDRQGTLATRGGYFISEDPYAFDASFFNLTYQEALALDPLIRQALEVTYECMEDGGIPMDRIKGSRTAVYMGSGMSDYHDALVKDPEHVPRYSALGASTEMLANRLSYVFDWHGPSVAVQTACSSSLVAIHLACQSIRCGDADMAVAGGSSLVLTPEVSTYLGNLNFLSPGGHCLSFDEAGDGFARGEGCGVVLLKRLDVAIRDGDSIRAIIRGSGVNSDGLTPGISFPSSSAQAELIRSVYNSAGLSLSSTQYVEAHGTGTKAGDPVEVKAIHDTIGVARQDNSYETPLLVGSVKPNIGHLEAASAVAGLIKGILALENKLIPPNIRLERLNTSIPFKEWNIHVPTNPMPWPEAAIRQMSISSFGAGGTNAHCVLTEASVRAISDALAPASRAAGEEGRVNQITGGYANGDGSNGALEEPAPRFQGRDIPTATSRTQLFILSSHDQPGIERIARSLVRFLDDRISAATGPSESRAFLADLAYTLGQRRSRLAWKAACVASDTTELVECLASFTAADAVRADSGPGTPQLGFVFTGQGAHWAGMGIELINRFPTFRLSVQQCSDYLRQHCGCPWDAMEELSKTDPKCPLATGNPEFTQTLCTLLQIALVDEFRAWCIVPAKVVGHSSGEIAAAYCAGFLSKENAAAAAYFRGLASADLLSNAGSNQVQGGMMAVGLSTREAQEWIRKAGFALGEIAIACENSPGSTTLSGDKDALQKLAAMLDRSSIFQRLLQTGVAYHSSHMNLVMADYSMAMSDLDDGDDAGRPEISHRPTMYSSVTGSAIDETEIGPYYWVRNMVSPVLFSQALSSLVNSHEVDILVELGPHSTLAGPIKQTLDSLGDKRIRYFPSLVRKKDAVRTTLTLAGQLLCLGVPVDLPLINKGTRRSPRHLVGLPPYPWNHSRSFRHQVRSHADWLTREHPRRSLLGTRVAPNQELTHAWRNMVRLSEEPWLRQHMVMGITLLPASAMVCMAIEAARQTCDPGSEVHGYKLRDVKFLSTITIDENDSVETLVSLRPHGLGSRTLSSKSAAWSWLEFTVSTCKTAGQPIRDNCKGLIQVRYKEWNRHAGMDRELKECQEARSAEYNHILATSPHEKTADMFYGYTEVASWEFGHDFRLIFDVKTNKGQGAFAVRVPDWRESSAMDTFSRGQQERPFVIHPAILDAAFQSWGAGVWGEDPTFDLQRPLVPTMIDELDVSADVPCPFSLTDTHNGHGRELKAYSKTRKLGFKDISFDVCFLDHSLSTVYLDCRGFRSTQLADVFEDSAVSGKPTTVGNQYWTEICDKVCWDVDLKWTEESELNRLLSTVPPNNTLQKLLRLVLHAEPALTVVEILPTEEALNKSSMGCLGPVPVSNVFYAILEPSETFEGKDRPQLRLLDGAGKPVDVTAQDVADLVVLTYPGCWYSKEGGCTKQALLAALKVLLKRSGRVICASSDARLQDVLRPQNGFHVLHRFPEAGDVEPVNPSGVILVSREASADLLRAAEDGSDTQGGQREAVVILTAGSDSDTAIHGFSSEISSLLRHRNVSCLHALLGDGSLEKLDNKTCICLFDLEGAILRGIEPDTLDLVRQVFERAKRVIWISDGDDPDKYVADGLVRVLRYEFGKKPFQILHLPRLNKNDVSGVEAAAAATARIILRPQSTENEFRVNQNGHIMTSRYSKDKEMNETLIHYLRERTLIMPLRDHGSHLKLTIKKPGLMDTFCFTSMKNENSESGSAAGAPGVGMVQIEVHASGINFRDVMASMGIIPDSSLGGEASGVVTAIGPGVSRIKVGDSVSALCHQSHATTVTAREECCITVTRQSRLSMEEHAAMPVVHATAYYALVKLARLRPGQSVLVHAAAGGVGQAALQLAKHIGLEIFATVGSDEKQDFLISEYGIDCSHIFSSRNPSFADGILRMTGGRGVDCILNNVSGELLRQSWLCLAPLGTFVELGLRDILENTPLDMRPFAKGATFSFFDLGKLMAQEPETVLDIRLNVASLAEQGVLAPPKPLTVYPVERLEEAFRTMQSGKHRGKLVLSFRDACGPVSISPDDAFHLDSKATYVLVGGTGGLGRSLAQMFIDAGARNLVFVSRSGLSNAPGKAAYEKLKAEKGSRIGVYKADIADYHALKAVLKQCSTDGFPPIRGVVQLAMVLRDVPFEKMSHDDWVQSTRAKVEGSWNLHRLFGGGQINSEDDRPASFDADDGLDFFIMLASVAGIIGNEAQANYAAGNTFQDALAHYRRSFGLRGTAIDLGIMKDVGVVAEKGAVGKMLRTYEEVLGINEPVFHALIKSVINSERAGAGAPAQICTGLPTADRLREHGVARPEYLEHEPRFSALNALGTALGVAQDSGAPQTAAPTESVEAALASANSQEAAAAYIANALAGKIADIMGIPASEVEVGRGMYTYGVDSLVALEVRNWISQTFKTNVPLLEVLEAKPMLDFAWKLAERSTLVRLTN